ncbi:4-hydroxy-2-oxovalerate aldolase [Sphingomonas oleivorans]|uniref:4-hydroxy-2-oxovalerate aldolase n=1 Tax=Sphingomonas oleivorans TaxID=1735121 RepID=A0A2T5G287_9SPHN|nr:aldolase/citrate lyase family protein [Sphingomonas oleivorans]PTQ13231.1 4-hydroxy-2-oxovalerate aldolase [Sphingomonas oleivorans]
MLRPNRLKQRLRAGERSIGCWLFMGSPTAAEILSHCGYDALLIDHEHSPGGLETAVDQLRAIAPSPVTTLVRLGDNIAAPVKQALDSGADGIVAANVEDADTLERLVAAALYPPLGKRGAHFTVSRAARWGLDGDLYAANADKELLVIAMIESAAGVAAIPELARVANVDMFFIGPLDLSASIGLMGRYTESAFVELLDEAERRTREAGIALGGAALPGHDAAALFDRGYAFVTAASDVGLLRDGGLQMARPVLRT